MNLSVIRDSITCPITGDVMTDRSGRWSTMAVT